MFKHVKKAFLLIALVLVSVLAFACGDEINKETCKDYCDPAASKETCKDYCDPSASKDTCKDYCDPAASKDTCKNYCEKPNYQSCKEFITKDNCKEHINEDNCNEKGYGPNAENCKEYAPIVAPTEFLLLEDFANIDEPMTMSVEDFLPLDNENVYKGLYWYSSDEEVATVGQDGVITAHRPGVTTITAVSVLDSNVKSSATLTVRDNRADEYAALEEEAKEMLSQIPVYASESFDFPKPWNKTVEMTVTNSDQQEVSGFVYPEKLEKDMTVTYQITLKLGTTEKKIDVKIWAVKDAKDNVVNRLNAAITAAETLIQDYINGALVDTDLLFPTVVYGASLTWDSALPNKISDEGKYTRQLDDTPVTVNLVAKCGDNAKSNDYRLVAKGYTKEEKIAYILNEGSLAQVAGKEVATSIVLPAFDSKFKAALTYTSNKPEVMDNTGKLVAPVTEKTEVEFTVNIDYSFSKNYAFKEDAKFVVTVVPQNEAAKAAEEWLQSSEFKSLVNFAYGTEKGNVLDVPTKYTMGEVEYEVKWDVTPAVVAPKYLADEKEEADRVMNAFVLTEEGKPELVVQYLRYTQVPIKATFAKDGVEATIALVLNIGASTDATAIYTATWESGDQKDGSLNQRTGAWDCVPNASNFDKAVGYVARNLGYGYWSGYKVAAQFNGANYEYFNMDYMYWEVAEDEDGNIVKVPLSLFNNAGDMGGNWGWFMKNTTNHDIFIEVGTYAATDQNYKGSEEAVTTLGSRLSWSMDGYALGFVADKDGNVLHGAGSNKLQTSMPKENLVEVGSEAAKYLVGDTTTKGSKVHYFVVPAGGYAMSWKYQFYGLGDIHAVEPFCNEGTKVEITKYGVHPLNSTKATTATTRLTNAETAIAKGGIDNNKAIENNLIEARNIYNNDLFGITKEKVFEAARLEAAETAYAAMLDAELNLILSKEGQTLPEGEKPFVTQMGEMYTRLQKLTSEIIAKLTAKAAFDAKYDELSKIELTVTLDYNGGYAKGLYSGEDFDIVIPQLLSDIYDWFIEQGAFKKKVDEDGNLVDDPEGVVPSREEFNNAYFGNNYAKYATTVLTHYLFTPKYESDKTTLNENYHDVIEGTTKFFNSEKYHDKWIDIMDFVDEATRKGNMGGQDAWGRCNEISQPAKWSSEDLVSYGGKQVTITNAGASLGAYRFAQYIAGSIGKTVYKDHIPADHYAAIFDRQQTQERFSTVIYHCTDGKVELPKAAHKDGAEFAGWFFENGEPAEITGAYFKDVTVYAKWNPIVEEKVEQVVGEDVEAVYYGAPLDTGKNYMKATPTGTINDQVNAVGLSKYAMVVAGKMFILPKFAAIELGKDATADITLSKKEEVQVYGTDGTAQNSTGLIYDEKTDTVKAQNSFGHGALYINAGEFNVTISQAKLTYGRDLNGAGYGYHRYHFVYDAEKNSYTGKLVKFEDSVTLAKGDLLWCPMTAERYCSGLTDCDGTSGVKGVLSEGIEAKLVDISSFLPVDVEWHTVKFVDGEKVVNAQYLEKGQKVVKPEDLKLSGYQFVGWNTEKEATEGIEIVEELTEDVTYYAIWKKLDKFDAVTVEAGYTGDDPQTFANFYDAINSLKDGGTITVKAGSYEGFVISKPLTIIGPNSTKDAAHTIRAEEAVITTEVTINAGLENVTIKGLKFESTLQTVADGSITNYNVEYNYFTTPKQNSFLVSANGVNVVFKHNYLNCGDEKTAYGYRPWRISGVAENCVFEDNTLYSTSQSYGSGIADAVYIQSVKGTFDFNNNVLTFPSNNFGVNIASLADATVVNIKYNVLQGTNAEDKRASGYNLKAAGAETQINFVGNKLFFVGGTLIQIAGGKLSFSDNYLDVTGTLNLTSSEVSGTGNYIPETITYKDGSKQLTAEGNYTTKEEYKPLQLVAEISLAGAQFGKNVWACDNTKVQLNTTNGGTNWDRLGIEYKEGQLMITGMNKPGEVTTAAYSGATYRLTWFSNTGIAFAETLNIEVGQIVVFEGVNFLTGVIAENAKVSIYKVK